MILMEYPEEFKKKVLSLTGKIEDIEKMLDSGNENLGYILNSSTMQNISAQELIEAYESDNIELLYEKAKRIIAYGKLYEEWKEMHIIQVAKIREKQKPNGIHK